MSKHAELGLIITTTDGRPAIAESSPRQEFGDDGTDTVVTGEIRRLVITRDGKSQFGISIGDDGRIILSDYGNMGFQTLIPGSVQYIPMNPWGQ